MGEPLSQREPPRIPGYRIEGVLGRGATGTVYKARQLSVDRLVALKVLHPDLVGAQGAERRLQREARATARLAHPHIISAFDMGSVEGVWWYAMELVDGVSLHKRIQESPFNEREALRTFIPLVEALQHAFERGVVHRDIKPANILVDASGRALLVDLGLAYADDDPQVTKSGATLGTPHYISPEQARDPSQADAQSDLWSMGATIFHAVCGRPPFQGDSVAEILSAVLYAPVPDPLELAPQISKGLALVLRKCLTRARAHRYQTPAELLADLERVRERRAPNVRRATLEPVEQRRARLWWAGAVAGVVALAGAVWIAVELGGRGSPQHGAPPAVAQPEDPVDRLLAAAEGPSGDLGPALARAVQLVRSLPPDSPAAQRAATARAHLEARLAAEIQRFQLAAEPRVEAALGARRFGEAERLAREDLRAEFSALTGAAALPPDLEQTLTRWTARLGERAAQRRSEAESGFRTALLNVWRTRIEPEVRAHADAGRWRSARELLTTGVAQWTGDPAIPRAGIPPEALDAALARLREDEIEPARTRLDARWNDADAELKAWVAKRAQELRGALEGRTLSDGAAVLRAEWELELERRRMTIEQMPAGLLHLGHEELVKAERELTELARTLALDDARRGLTELEEEAQPAWRARRYEEALDLFERALEDVWRAPLRAEHALRAREARALVALLERVGAGVRKRDGTRIEVRLGTITLTGRLQAGIDPLGRGFHLLLDGGRSPALVLRPGAGPEGASIVGREFLEEFAGLAATPEDRLLRALLRLREGEAGAAREALDSGPLPLDEPLVADCERRVRAAFEARREATQERRTEALERYHLALREGREGADPVRLARRIQSILHEDSELLTDDEIEELRRLRDERMAEVSAGAPTLEDLLRPNALEPLAAGRVRLRYDFAEPRAGGFDPGTWIADGPGWAPVRAATSDKDLMARSGPNLVLRAPLHVATEPVDLRLSFQARAEAAPDVLLVTCAGFHVCFVAGKSGRPGRCHVDAGDAAQVLARARAGEGTQVAALRAAQAFDLRIVANRMKEVVSVELDGKRVLQEQRKLPKDDLADRLVSVRSSEVVRLASVAIEVGVR